MILRSLVRQLAWAEDGESLAFPVSYFYQKHSKDRLEDARLSIEEASALLTRLICLSNETTIIIDAMDECAHPYDLFRSLRTVMAGAKERLRLLVTGRSHVDVSNILTDCTKITLESHDVSADILYYVKNEIKEGPRQLLEKKKPDLEDRLIEILCARAQGMFRWVELQLAIFLDEDDPLLLPESVEDRLDQLHKEVGLPDLKAVYSEIYERNSRKSVRDRDHATKCYRLILCSEIPMRGCELAKAIALNVDGSWNPSIDEGYVRKICSNFLIIVGDDHVRFAHLSVIEYLKGDDFLGHFSNEQSHIQAAEVCLLFIHHHIHTVADETCEGFPKYALYHWPYHCQQVSVECRKKGSLKKLLQNYMWMPYGNKQFRKWSDIMLASRNPLLERDNCYQIWTYGHRKAVDWRTKLCVCVSWPNIPFFTACAFGLEEIVGKYLLDLPDILLHDDIRNVDDMSGLMIAAMYGHISTIQTLLVYGADVNACDQRGANTALDLALASGHKTAAKLLEDAGGKLGVRVGKLGAAAPSHRPDLVHMAHDDLPEENPPCLGFSTTLLAGYVRIKSVDGVRYLLKCELSGPEMVAQHEGGLSSLSEALYAGSLEIVKGFMECVNVDNIEKLRTKESIEFIELLRLLKQADDTKLLALCEAFRADNNLRKEGVTYVQQCLGAGESGTRRTDDHKTSHERPITIRRVATSLWVLLGRFLLGADIAPLMICLLIDSIPPGYI
ncbi:MAG: hypothetical protein Q9164_006474 [Protoblastenia rupestris]